MVPGDVHLDLMRRKDIEDPLIRDNAAKCAWIGEHEWWYEKSFRWNGLEGARHELIFEGLCYVADVWLNGEHLGRHLNMHRHFTVDVSGKLCQTTENLLVIRLLAFDDEALKVPLIERHTDLEWSEGITNKNYCIKRGATHKALYTFGWDWTQGLPICGIWRDVKIESTPVAKIDALHVISNRDGGVKVTFACETVLREIKEGEVTLVLREKSSGREACRKNSSIHIGPGRFEYSVEGAIKAPKLWWPAGLGAQFLYEAELTLSVDGKVVSERVTRFAIRSFEIQEPMVSNDQGGFRFIVNGVYVFAKGTNWIPPDIIPARIDDQRYETLLDQYIEAGFNYLRFWGGGIYERQHFYDLCDEKGILILHDMMFSCLEVPDFNLQFVEEVVRELEYNVKRLRNHPSIVIWCGANEADLLPDWGIQPRPNGEYYGYRLYHRIFPELFAKLDPTRPYIPCDPYRGKNNSDGRVSNPKHGTCHGNFGMNAFSSDEEIDRQGVPSFVNECYAASPSPVDSLLKYLNEADLNWGNSIFKSHEIATVQMLGDEKTNFSENIYHHSPLRFSDIPFDELASAFTTNHSQLIKRFTEALRLRRERCGGVAYWMFDSAFTMNDWSMSDYYCLPKAAFYEAKRSNRNLLPVIAIYNDRIEFHILNDLLVSCAGKLYCEIKKFSGELVWGKSKTFEAKANAASKHISILRRKLKNFDPSECYVVVVCKPNAGEDISNHRLFLSPIKLKIPNTQVQISAVRGKPGTFVLSTNSFVKNLRIKPHTTEVRVDDNFFDLLPGISKIVRFNKPLKMENVQLEWDNNPKQYISFLEIEKLAGCEEQIPPFSWRCTVYNPTAKTQTLQVAAKTPVGIFASHQASVDIGARATLKIPFTFTVDPITTKPGTFPIDITIGDQTICESIGIRQPFRISKDGYLEISHRNGSQFKANPWFLKRQTLTDRHAALLPLSAPVLDHSGLCRSKLDLPPDTLPYSCEIWNSNGKIVDFYGGRMNAKSLWGSLPHKPFKAADLQVFPTQNIYWPDLIKEGHGFLINSKMKDAAVEWKCKKNVETLLFLHHDKQKLYFNVFIRNMPFYQPFTGVNVWQNSCLEIVLGTKKKSEYVDFSLALTPLGCEQYYRRGIKSGLEKDPHLKVFYQAKERFTSYHYAFPKTVLPGLLDGDAIRLALSICEKKPKSHITLFNGVVAGLGTAKSGTIPLV